MRVPSSLSAFINRFFQFPVNIIYDADNLPDAIYNEYSPWKSHHKKFVFNEKDLNKKIINCLE